MMLVCFRNVKLLLLDERIIEGIQYDVILTIPSINFQFLRTNVVLKRSVHLLTWDDLFLEIT